MRRAGVFLAACFLIGAIAGCATVSSRPQTPAQAVYAITADYATGLTAAVEYGKLPRCGSPGAEEAVVIFEPCSDERVLMTLRVYSDAAYAAIKAAEGAALAPHVTDADKRSARLDAIVAVANFVEAVAEARR